MFRMLQKRRQPGFVLEHPNELRVGALVRKQPLDDEGTRTHTLAALAGRRSGQENLGHAAFSQLAVEQVFAVGEEPRTKNPQNRRPVLCPRST